MKSHLAAVVIISILISNAILLENILIPMLMGVYVSNVR